MSYNLFSDAAKDTALDAVGGTIMGSVETELLKQVFVAVGNGGGGSGLPTTGGTMTGDITMADGTNINIEEDFGGVGTIIGGATSKIGLFGNTPIFRPDVSGSRGNPEEALASLLAALASFGIITDSTTT
jgi:hypothetical protein